MSVNLIKSLRVNGVAYSLDYNTLANVPNNILSSLATNANEGKLLGVSNAQIVAVSKNDVIANGNSIAY